MIDEDSVIFPEYMYKSISGNKYAPVFDKKRVRWWLVTRNNVLPFSTIAMLCDIPDEDATLLKLRYGV